MKFRTKAVILAAVTIIALIPALIFTQVGPAAAAQDIVVRLDGQTLTFDVPPSMQQGRTLVPLRAIFEALGADVQWRAETGEIHAVRGDREVTLTIGQTQARVAGEPKTLDVPAMIMNGRTLVPLRFVSEALLAEVIWDGANRTVTILSQYPQPPPALGQLEVHFIDVGQGDSIFVRMESGETMLIDAGPRDAGAHVVSYLKSLGVTRLDLVVATHAHADHVGGLALVIQEFEVGRVLDPGVPHTTKTYEDFLAAVSAKPATMFELARRGGSHRLGAAVFEILWPEGDVSRVADLNDSSIAGVLIHGDVRILLTGDLASTHENSISVAAQVLKVGHHGSRYSTGGDFLDAVRPVSAIICVGKNDYGHPAPQTLERLELRGIAVYRTDISGTIRLTSDGKNYWISAQAVTPQQPAPVTGKYVGSSRSDKYHYPSCRYAASILPEHLVRFIDEQDAQAKGYVPCGVCKPPL